jgi:hypothetical protein
MNTPVYHIRFVGGPSDGVVVVATSFPFGEKLWMPAGPVSVRAGCKNSYLLVVRPYRSVYRMNCRHHTVEDGCTTIWCDYDFSGFEFLDAPIPSKPVLRSKRCWLGKLVGLASRRRGWKLWLPLPEGRP